MLSVRNGLKYPRRDGPTDGPKDGHTDGPKDGHTDRPMDGQPHGRKDLRTDGIRCLKVITKYYRH